MKNSREGTLKLDREEEDEMNDPLKERTLSWKDEKVNGGSLTTTNTWFDDFAVEVSDIPLKTMEEFKGPLKPKVLNTIAQMDGDNDCGLDSSSHGGRSPQSPNNWGFFVSITPPQAEIFAKVKADSVAKDMMGLAK